MERKLEANIARPFDAINEIERMSKLENIEREKREIETNEARTRKIEMNDRLITNLNQQLRRKNPKVGDVCYLPNGKWTVWYGISYVGTYDTPLEALDVSEYILTGGSRFLK
jgi:hypothetical protein